jgi:hypothetical protein
MTFRDQIEADVSAVFLNPDEFAGMHTIDGKSVVCVLDEDSDGEFAGDVSEGVYITRKRLLARDGDLAKTPVQGRRLVIDGRPYLCLDVDHEDGMLVVTVTENASA